jgi:hypothetical protein
MRNSLQWKLWVKKLREIAWIFAEFVLISEVVLFLEVHPYLKWSINIST